MLTRIAVIALFLTSCTTGASGVCQSPVHDACAQKSEEISSEIAKVAAQQHKTAEEMNSEFMGACEGQLQADLDQTLPAIQAIIDAGSQQKDSAP